MVRRCFYIFLLAVFVLTASAWSQGFSWHSPGVLRREPRLPGDRHRQQASVGATGHVDLEERQGLFFKSIRRNRRQTPRPVLRAEDVQALLEPSGHEDDEADDADDADDADTARQDDDRQSKEEDSDDWNGRFSWRLREGYDAHAGKLAGGYQQVREGAAGVVTTTTTTACSDNAVFLDKNGRGCHFWKGSTCPPSRDNFTRAQMRHIRWNCKSSCGLCKDYQACKDNHKYADQKGYTCQGWAALNCDVDAQAFGYTSEDIEELKMECRQACKTCKQAPMIDKKTGKVCSNNKNFVDSRGYDCSAWAGFDCNAEASVFGYSEEAAKDVRANCCRACDEVNRPFGRRAVTTTTAASTATQALTKRCNMKIGKGLGHAKTGQANKFLVAESAAACQLKCATSPCAVWTWTAPSSGDAWAGRCVMWNLEQAIQNGWIHAHNWVSQPKITSGACVQADIWKSFGPNTACRIDAGDKTTLGGGNVNVSTAANLSACQLLCQDRVWCQGIEYKQTSKRCELWRRHIGATFTNPGFQCLRIEKWRNQAKHSGQGDSVQISTQALVMSCIMEIDKSDVHPRGDDPSAWPVTSSAAECRKSCAASLNCAVWTWAGGSSSGDKWASRCVTWSLEVAIKQGWSSTETWVHKAGITSGLCVQDGKWHSLGTGTSCRDASRYAQGSGHIVVISDVPSLAHCKLECQRTTLCQGIEYELATKRCKVWKIVIDTANQSPGFECLQLRTWQAPGTTADAAGDGEVTTSEEQEVTTSEEEEVTTSEVTTTRATTTSTKEVTTSEEEEVTTSEVTTTRATTTSTKPRPVVLAGADLTFEGVKGAVKGELQHVFDGTLTKQLTANALAKSLQVSSENVRVTSLLVSKVDSESVIVRARFQVFGATEAHLPDLKLKIKALTASALGPTLSSALKVATIEEDSSPEAADVYEKMAKAAERADFTVAQITAQVVQDANPKEEASAEEAQGQARTEEKDANPKEEASAEEAQGQARTEEKADEETLAEGTLQDAKAKKEASAEEAQGQAKTAEKACADIAGYADEKGFACTQWMTEACSDAAEQWGYSQSGEDDLFTNCRRACRACDEEELASTTSEDSED